MSLKGSMFAVLLIAFLCLLPLYTQATSDHVMDNRYKTFEPSHVFPNRQAHSSSTFHNKHTFAGKPDVTDAVWKCLVNDKYLNCTDVMWSSCDCGTCCYGTSTRAVRCFSPSLSSSVDDPLCDPFTKPVGFRPCQDVNTCNYSWYCSNSGLSNPPTACSLENQWGTCSGGCSDNGLQTRHVHCMRSDNVVVDHSYCVSVLGTSQSLWSKPCLVADCEYIWKCVDASGIGVMCSNALYGACFESVITSGLYQRTRTVACFNSFNIKVSDSLCDSQNRPQITKSCAATSSFTYAWKCAAPGTKSNSNVTWFDCDSDMSQVLGPCDETCGDGVSRRDVGCVTNDSSLTLSASHLCSHEQAPDDVIPCHNITGCNYNWKCQSTSANALLDCTVATSFGVCSASCGQGAQSRIVSCRDAHGRLAPESSCTSGKPVSLRSCYGSTCPAQWMCGFVSSPVVSSLSCDNFIWPLCSNTEGCGQITLSRRVGCYSDNTFTQLSDSLCSAEIKPVSTYTCTDQSKCVWTTSPWSNCYCLDGSNPFTEALSIPSTYASGLPNEFVSKTRVLTRPTTKTASVGNVQPIDTLSSYSSHNMGVLATVVEPALKNRTRWCMSSVSHASYPDALCSSPPPPINDTCSTVCTYSIPTDPESEPVYSYEWVTSPWSICSSSCGEGISTRTLSCQQTISYGDEANTISTVSDEHCHTEDDTPDTQQPCTGPVCPTYTWLAGDWGVCNGLCGTGSRNRNPTCIKTLNEETTEVNASFCTTPPPYDTEMCDVTASACVHGTCLNTVSSNLNDNDTNHLVTLPVQSSDTNQTEPLLTIPITSKCICFSNFYGILCEREYRLTFNSISTTVLEPTSLITLNWNTDKITDEYVTVTLKPAGYPSIILGKTLSSQGVFSFTVPERLPQGSITLKASVNPTKYFTVPNVTMASPCPYMSCSNGECNPNTGQCVCSPGFFGDFCTKTICSSCDSLGTLTCDIPNKQCLCKPGFSGIYCQSEDICPMNWCSGTNGSPTSSIIPNSCDKCNCRNRWYGNTCEACNICSSNGVADSACSSCKCMPGYAGPSCSCRGVAVALYINKNTEYSITQTVNMLFEEIAYELDISADNFLFSEYKSHAQVDSIWFNITHNCAKALLSTSAYGSSAPPLVSSTSTTTLTKIESIVTSSTSSKSNRRLAMKLDTLDDDSVDIKVLYSHVYNLSQIVLNPDSSLYAGTIGSMIQTQYGIHTFDSLCISGSVCPTDYNWPGDNPDTTNQHAPEGSNDSGNVHYAVIIGALCAGLLIVTVLIVIVYKSRRNHKITMMIQNEHNTTGVAEVNETPSRSRRNSCSIASNQGNRPHPSPHLDNHHRGSVHSMSIGESEDPMSHASSFNTESEHIPPFIASFAPNRFNNCSNSVPATPGFVNMVTTNNGAKNNGGQGNVRSLYSLYDTQYQNY